MKKNNLKKGIAPLLILLIITLLTGGGSAIYLKIKDKPLSLNSVKENIFGFQGNDTLESIKIENIDFEFSSSPLPKLETTALNIEIPKINNPKIGSVNTNLDFDFSLNKNDIEIPMPNIGNLMPSIVIPAMPNIEIPKGVNIPASQTPTTQPEQSPAGAPAGKPNVDCSMFISVPSCSYVPAGQAQDTCKQCFPNK